MFSRKSVITGKIETTYGTDSTPDAASDAIRVSNLQSTPLAAQYQRREIVDARFGSFGMTPVGIHSRVSFDVELVGGGAAGTPPPFATVLRVCSLAETINVGTDVQYAPISDDPESGSFYGYLNGSFKKHLGLRGTGVLSFSAGAFPKFSFEGTALYVPSADIALPNATYPAAPAPIALSNANTPTHTLHGVSLSTRALTVTLGNSVIHRDIAGDEGVLITGRFSTGRLSVDRVLTASFNPEAVAAAQTQDAFQFVHGTVAGNIIQIDAPKTQIVGIDETDDNGIAGWDLALDFGLDTADSELLLTFK
ncbi:MAG: phage tail tube protein [Magnetospiraceae bacterium]